MVLLGVGVLAGEFTNLDFESADLSGAALEFRRSPTGGPPLGGYPFGTGSAESLLPGWRVYFGDVLTNTVAIGNGFTTAQTVFDGPNHAALFVPGDYYLNADSTFLFGQPDGNHALILDNSFNFSPNEQPRMRVEQTGDVPADATWLTFRRLRAPQFFLRIDDRSFPTRTLIGDSSDPARLWFDISPWAGQTVRLGIEGSFGGHDVIDSIAFVVPEPGTLTLFVVGAAGFAAVALSRRRR